MNLTNVIKTNNLHLFSSVWILIRVILSRHLTVRLLKKNTMDQINKQYVTLSVALQNCSTTCLNLYKTHNLITCNCITMQVHATHCLNVTPSDFLLRGILKKSVPSGMKFQAWPFLNICHCESQSHHYQLTNYYSTTVMTSLLFY